MLCFIRLFALAVASFTLIACSSGAKLGGGKEGAAKALFEASYTASKNSHGNLSQAIANGADPLVEIDIDCAQDGSVRLELQTTNDSGAFVYSLHYNDCNEDGFSEFNGTMTMESSIVVVGNSAEIINRLKGRLDIGGRIDDFIDVDVTETIRVEALDSNAGEETIRIDGRIVTFSATYTYANESLVIVVDAPIPADDDTNS